MHTAVGMWFTMLSLGIAYYAIPRILGRPIYSYALGVLGFWTNIVFYTLIGAHHFIFSPVPWWLQTTAILFSVGMMVPVWAGGGNLLLTFRGASAVLQRSYAAPFLLSGIVAYVLVEAAEPMWLWRTAGGVLMVASHLVFAVNVWAMRPGRALAATPAAPPVEASA